MDFSKFDDALALIDKLRNSKTGLNEIKDDQIKLRSDLGEIRRVQKKQHLLKESKNSREIIENLYNARQAAIDFLMNIFQEHLKLNVKQKKEQELKY